MFPTHSFGHCFISLRLCFLQKQTYIKIPSVHANNHQTGVDHFQQCVFLFTTILMVPHQYLQLHLNQFSVPSICTGNPVHPLNGSEINIVARPS